MRTSCSPCVGVFIAGPSEEIENGNEIEEEEHLENKLNGVCLSNDNEVIESSENTTKKKKKRIHKKKTDSKNNEQNGKGKQTVPPSIPISELFSDG